MMPTANKFYTFSDFVLNPVKRSLFQGNIEIKLGNKDFDVLLFLVENNLRFFSFDEIIKAVWNGTNVHNNSVEKIIANIRKALGDDSKSSRFIKTRRGVGYSFTYEVQEIEEYVPVMPNENFNNFQPEKIEFNSQPQNPKVLKTKLLGFCFASIILLFSGIFWLKGCDILARFNSTPIFADDFSDTEIDYKLWVVKGETVNVEKGITKLVVKETDNWGRLESQYFSFDPNKPITIKSRIKVTYSQNIKDKTYFHGYFGLTPKTSLIDEAAIKHRIFFGVKYANYDYESKYSDGSIDEQPSEGFFLVKNGGDAVRKIDYQYGKISPRIKPVWDKWFEQKIIYEPFSGNMSYFIDENLKGDFNVGQFSTDLQENKLRLEINPEGWWLYHSIEIDYIEVTQ